VRPILTGVIEVLAWRLGRVFHSHPPRPSGGGCGWLVSVAEKRRSGQSINQPSTAQMLHTQGL